MFAAFRRIARWFLVTPLLLILMPGARAQSRWIDEAKLGLMEHDISLGGHHVERGPDVNGEVLFPSPSFLDAIGGPRPDLGASVNTAARTSYAYTGLIWTVRPWRWLFAGFGLGGAVHDGQLDGYQITSALSLSLLVDHISNANLARHNQGLTNFGLRTGFRF
jgi:lipid A 3-O-deacylase